MKSNKQRLPQVRLIHLFDAVIRCGQKVHHLMKDGMQIYAEQEVPGLIDVEPRSALDSDEMVWLVLDSGSQQYNWYITE